MNMVNTFITIVTFLLGVGAAAASFMAWHEGSSRKKYAAERDFLAIQDALKSQKSYLEQIPQVQRRFAEIEKSLDHTKNSMKQMSASSISITDGIEHQLTELRLELKEIKSYVIGNSQRIDSILTRLDAQSGIFSRRKEE